MILVGGHVAGESALSLSVIPWCAGTQWTVTSLSLRSPRKSCIFDRSPAAGRECREPGRWRGSRRQRPPCSCLGRSVCRSTCPGPAKHRLFLILPRAEVRAVCPYSISAPPLVCGLKGTCSLLDDDPAGEAPHSPGRRAAAVPRPVVRAARSLELPFDAGPAAPGGLRSVENGPPAR